MGFNVELKYPIQNNMATTMSGQGQYSGPHNDVITYLKREKRK